MSANHTGGGRAGHTADLPLKEQRGGAPTDVLGGLPGAVPVARRGHQPAPVGRVTTNVLAIQRD